MNTPCSPSEIRSTVNILFHQFDQYIADLTPQTSVIIPKVYTNMFYRNQKKERGQCAMLEITRKNNYSNMIYLNGPLKRWL